MTPLLLSQIAAWCSARLLGDDATVPSITIDSRHVAAGALFVAIVGERFDGHDFCAQAAQAGAAALLVSRPVQSDLPQLLCADTVAALGDIAAAVQAARATRVFALTGSNGKTSVKALLLAILSRQAPSYANPGNRNNEIGLPLAVLDAPEQVTYAIYEMGAGKPDDIAYLSSIARPDIALVNNIAPAHLERMGSLLGIAQTKAAIYEALPADGVAIINADDAFSQYFADIAKPRRCLRYGLEHSADINADRIAFDDEGSRFQLHLPDGSVPVRLLLQGRHNVMNALAAAAMAHAAGVSAAVIADGLCAARGVPGRQQVRVLSDTVQLIDDSYNANPGSVAAAIDRLAAFFGDRWLVLGDMAELGEGSAILHAELGDRARRAGLSALWTVGNLSQASSRAFGDGGRHFHDQATLIQALRAALAERVMRTPLQILVKGSRSSAMENVVAALCPALSQPGSDHAA